MTTTAPPPGKRRVVDSRPSRPALPSLPPLQPLSPRERERVATLSTTSTMVLLVCGWALLQLLALSGLSQARDQDVLYDRFRSEVAAATAPTGPVVPVGDPVALLRIPNLGLEQVVVEGTSSGDLQAGPGHRRNTVLPGQQGVSMVYGKASTYGAPFADLAVLKAGDTVVAITAQGESRFEVRGVRRAGDPVPALAAGAARLTLVTADTKGPLGGLAPGSAIYVDADRTGPDTGSGAAYPAPSGRPAAIPSTEDVMARDTGALPLLALQLGALLVLTLAAITARQRWRPTLVWVLVAPVTIALAWTTTDTVARLLPNLV